MSGGREPTPANRHSRESGNPYVDGPRLARPGSRDGSGRLRSYVRPPAFARAGFCARSERPLAQMGFTDRVPNRAVMSEHRWVPRVVPILGLTDRHLAAVLASARAGHAASGLRRCRPAIEFAAHQHGPDDAGHLVGERYRCQLLWLARQQLPATTARPGPVWPGGSRRWRRAPRAGAGSRLLPG